MDCTCTLVVVRCVHHVGFLADDAWGWKWPGRGPGSTYRECCWVDTLAVRWAPTIRWLPLRFLEERETCYVWNVPSAESWRQGLWSTMDNPTTMVPSSSRWLFAFCHVNKTEAWCPFSSDSVLPSPLMTGYKFCNEVLIGSVKSPFITSRLALHHLKKIYVSNLDS